MSRRPLSYEELNRIVADLEAKRALLATINDFALKLLGIPTANELAWYVAREVVGRLGFVDCVVYLVDAEAPMLQQVAAIGAKNPKGDQILNPLRIPFGQGITGHVAKTRQPIIVDDTRNDSRYIPDVEEGRAEICVPLIIDGHTVGAIDCEDLRPGHFNWDHLEILTMVAAMTSAKLKLINQTRRIEERTKELRRLNDQLRDEVAERERVQQELRDNRQLIQSVIDAVPAIISVKDRKGRFLLVNPAQAAFYGLTVEDMVGKPLEAVVPVDYANLTRTRDREVFESGQALVGFDESSTDRAGRDSSWYTSKVPIKVADGTVTAVLTTAINITERKQAEEALSKSEELFAKTFHASPGLFAIARPHDGKIYDVNETWLKVLGHSYQNALSKTAYELGIWRNPNDRAAFVERLVKDGSVRGFETVFCTKHGEELQVLVSAEKVEIHGEPRMLIVSQDVTALKLVEKRLHQAQKMEAIGQLTGGVAHDFNNLLGVIQGNAELLGNELGEDNKFLKSIFRASLRGAELTRHLLAFARRQPLRPRPVDLPGLIQGLSELLALTLGESIEIEVAAQPGCWPAIADPGQVENALLNLALNARDAMPAGGKLRITCANARLDEADVAPLPEASVGEYTVLTVRDTGHGMTAEHLARAFEPFFTTKDVGQGSGLGLSMVYGFAKQSGGHAIIASELGQGTIVTLYLPRAVSDPEVATAASPEQTPQGRGEVVLVIEDDPGRSWTDRSNAGKSRFSSDQRFGDALGADPHRRRAAHRRFAVQHRASRSGKRSRIRRGGPTPPAGNKNSFHVGIPGRNQGAKRGSQRRQPAPQ